MATVLCLALMVFLFADTFVVYAGGNNKKPNKVQGLKTTNVNTTSITISWTKVKKADGYEIIRNNKVVKRLQKTSFTDTNRKPQMQYSYTVRAYKNYKQKYYYNSKKKKWVTSKPKKAHWKGRKTRKVIKRRYGNLSKTITVKTKEAENPNANKIPILTYHRVVSDSCKEEYFKDNQWVAGVSDFSTQMKYLHDMNYRIISLQEFEDWYDGKIELPKKTAVLTFDDCDYELYYLIYPILKEHGFCATAFVIGSQTQDETAEYIENEKHYLGKDLINRIAEEYPSIQFQSHSFGLHARTSEGLFEVDTKTYEELDEDYKANSELGLSFEYIAYPYGQYNDDMQLAAQNNGMHMGFAFRNYVCATRKDDRYAIPRIKIDGQITFDEFTKKLNSYLK